MENTDINTVWRDVLENVKLSVSNAIFGTWFSQTHLISLTDSGERVSAVVGCHTPFAKSTIEARYFGLLQDSLSSVIGKKSDIVLEVKQKEAEMGDTINETPLFQSNKIDTDETLLNKIRSFRIKENFSFENFAVSGSNQMAHAAAEAVAQNPGVSYNPLFIWGGVGVGKSHIANAVALEVLKKNQDTKILFCTAEDFTNDIVEGIRNKTTQIFRDKYRKLDILLVDDIQFIAGKDTVQEEFFHTFNSVTRAGGQIILTSDRPPSEISKLEERLKSRFEAGLIVDIAPPDFELRCAIIMIKMKERGFNLPMEDVQAIASSAESARKIEGLLTRIISEAHLRKTDINSELIEGILGKPDTNGAQTKRRSSDEVVDIVCKYYSVGKRNLLGDSRSRPIARPRQILMYILRMEMGLPLEEVGRVVGGRDHTTVMHAVDKIKELASSDVQIREDILGIKRTL